MQQHAGMGLPRTNVPAVKTKAALAQSSTVLVCIFKPKGDVRTLTNERRFRRVSSALQKRDNGDAILVLQ